MEVDRPDLALASWESASKFFKNNREILNIIKYIKGNRFSDKYHASTSLQRLVISPRHRHDARVNKIAIEQSEEGIEIVYYKFGKPGVYIDNGKNGFNKFVVFFEIYSEENPIE